MAKFPISLMVVFLVMASFGVAFEPLYKTAVTYYSFDDDEITGSTVYDLGTAKNNATITGAAIGQNGKFFQSLYLDGTGDDITSLVNSGITGNDDTTMCAYIKVVGWANDDNIFAIGNAATREYRGLFQSNTVEAGGWKHIAYGDDFGAPAGNTINDNQWHHVCLVTHDNAASATLYFDGTNLTTHQYAAPLNTAASSIVIGNTLSGIGGAYHGYIDEFIMFDRTLNASDIEILKTYGPQYNGTFIPYLYNCSFNSTEMTALIITKSVNTSNPVSADIQYSIGGLTNQGLPVNLSGAVTMNTTLCLYPNVTTATMTGIIAYSYAGTDYEYNVNNIVFSSTYQEIPLYVSDATTRVTMTVKDTQDNVVSDAYISVLKYDIASNTFKTVEILNTNNDGEAVANLVLYTTWYRFIVVYDGVTYLSTDSAKIFTSTKNFNIDLYGDTWFDKYEEVQSISTSLTFNNASKRFTYSWTDTSGSPKLGCLRVINRTTNGDVPYGESCQNSPSATVTVDIGTDVEGKTFIASGNLQISGEWYPTDSLTISYFKPSDMFSKPNARDTSLFVSLFLIVSLVMVGAWSPQISVVLALVGLFVVVLLGLWEIATPWLIGIIIMGLIVVFKARQT